MILSGDVGGTKTLLALFEKGSSEPRKMRSFPSSDYPHLTEIMRTYLTEEGIEQVEGCHLAIAGPVIKNRCRTTNLPWEVDGALLAAELKLPYVQLMNDLLANAYALALLPQGAFTTLYTGVPEAGNRALVSPGTGLGEAGLYYDGTRYFPFACEGGHCEFGPRNELECALSLYLQRRFGHPSYERVLSGPGQYVLFEFLVEYQKREVPRWLREELMAGDPPRIVSEHGLSGDEELCKEALDLFVALLGAECGNVALKFMAVGGVYLGGGIPPKIRSHLEGPLLRSHFLDKGRMRPLLEPIPLYLIEDPLAALKGSTLGALRLAEV